MKRGIDRRQFLTLAGLGSAVVVSGSGLFGAVAEAASRYAREAEEADEFYFVQLSDTHWGFKGPAINPDAEGTLPKAIAAVNALDPAPDFVVFTGDLTHTTDDPAERRKRLAEFRDHARALKVKDVRYMPGEHDASLDRAQAYQEFFGATRYAFDHKGVHFIALDNVSDPRASLGDEQLQWLAADLAKLDQQQRIVVLAHRPLFDLAPAWDWATPDGAKAIEQLMPFANVVVFYGHIHQENHHMTGHIAHHSAKGLMFALPAPLSVPKKAPIPWNPAAPYQGLGWREIGSEKKRAELAVTEFGVKA